MPKVGFKHSVASKKKMRASQKKRVASPDYQNNNLGTKRSEEAKQKTSKSLRATYEKEPWRWNKTGIPNERLYRSAERAIRWAFKKIGIVLPKDI